jgi:hypothetical protein
MGIEPTLAAWEAAVLPLNYTRAGDVILRNRGAFWQSWAAGAASRVDDGLGDCPSGAGCGRRSRRPLAGAEDQ